ncbi:MAG TPA: dephospho-CoA kinase [Candidatus Omnitrophica bacterium]|nr:dephospho-CoA kinase [Candidatus Omnitrophota bacterium]
MKKLVKKKKMVIGITGGFGTGKSTAAGLLRKEGFLVLDADRIAHETLQATNPVFEKICEKFPDAMVSGFLERRKLAEIVFKNPARLKRLEKLIHPYVLKRFLSEIKKTKKKWIALEIPLLFESGFQKICDRVVTVFAGTQESDERLLSQGWTHTEIRRRRAEQWPIQKKMAKSDFVINNSGSKAEMRKQVRTLLKQLVLKK